MAVKIAYVMSRFPHLPETFILREMNELEKQGWSLELYPLIVQEQSVIHAESESWLPRLHALPFASWAVLRANGRALLSKPGTYLRLLARSISENRSDFNLLLRSLALFPKAIYAAGEMQAEGITHIHAHYATHPAFFAWLISRLTGITYSITVHAHDIFVRTAMLPTKLEAATFIAAISEFNRDYLANKVGDWVRDKTFIVHCGIIPAHYQPRVEPAQPGAPLAILSVGSLQPYKGHIYLLKACALLKERGIPFQAGIIGGGEERQTLEGFITKWGLKDEVSMLGPLPQSEVAAILPTASCFVQPSIITQSGKMEGIPVALMEALACAVPVVSSDISGIPELVNARTGILVPPANECALAEALTAVYREPEAAFARAQRGQQLVYEAFELQKNVAELISIFERYLPQEDADHRKTPFQTHGQARNIV